MKILTIANQKGGVAKTTTATAIASILQDKGYKVLLIDADMQGNSTDTYGATIDGVATLYDVILEEEQDKTPIGEAIQTTQYGDILASDPLLKDADTILQKDLINGSYRLQDALGELEGYDFVIIDTAPSMNSLLVNSLIASTHLIIPITASRYSLQGLSQLYETIKDVKKRPNPGLKISGLLLTKYTERTLLSREVKESLEEIAESIGTKIFNTTIRASVKTEEAQAVRLPLVKYAPNSTTAKDYKAFVDELLKEI